MWEIGARLRERRERAGLTQGQVAAYEDCSVSYLSQLERGENRPNVWPMLARLAARYHTSADYLLGLTDDAQPAGDNNDYLNPAEQQLIDLWRSLDHEQQAYVIETMNKLEKWSRPRIIGGEP